MSNMLLAKLLGGVFLFLVLALAVCFDLAVRVGELESRVSELTGIVKNMTEAFKDVKKFECDQQKINRLIHERIVWLEGSRSVSLPVSPECEQ